MSRFVSYIKSRLHVQNKNFLVVIVGATGSGKSYTGLRLCEAVDATFDLSRVCFTPIEFMELLTSGKLKRGSAILFDEAGVGMNSRNFQTATNKALNYIVQTFRSNNYMVVYTTPDYNFVDKTVRKLAHSLLETKTIDRDRELVWVKPLMIENNPQLGKPFMKFPRFKDNEHPRCKKVITKMAFRKPSLALCEAYETRKLGYNSRLQSDVLSSLRKVGASEAKPEKPKPDLPAICKEIMANKGRYLTKKGAINRATVGEDFALGGEYLNRLRQQYNLECERASSDI